MSHPVYFVWTPKIRLKAGVGGSETSLVGLIRGLKNRGVDARVVIVGLDSDVERSDFPDIQFQVVADIDEASLLSGCVIYMNQPALKSQNGSKVFSYLSGASYNDHAQIVALKNQHSYAPIITVSKFSRERWAEALECKQSDIEILYPFAAEDFAKVERKDGSRRLLFAGRLRPQKGIYVLLEALHLEPMLSADWSLTITAAGLDYPDAHMLKNLLKARENVRLIDAKKQVKDMAMLMAEHDVLVMPSRNDYWYEAFGMLSVEAQHAGCVVVASASGGLPETDCGIGTLILAVPQDPKDLSLKLYEAMKMPTSTSADRAKASRYYTLDDSVDSLLRIIGC